MAISRSVPVIIALSIYNAGCAEYRKVDEHLSQFIEKLVALLLRQIADPFEMTSSLSDFIGMQRVRNAPGLTKFGVRLTGEGLVLLTDQQTAEGKPVGALLRLSSVKVARP